MKVLLLVLMFAATAVPLVVTADSVSGSCVGGICEFFCEYGCQPEPMYAMTNSSADLQIQRYIEVEMAKAKKKIAAFLEKRTSEDWKINRASYDYC